MSEYKLHQNGSIIRINDGAWIPEAAGNADFAEYQNWLADGNTPDPADEAPPAPAPAPDPKIAFKAAVSEVLKDVLLEAGVINQQQADVIGASAEPVADGGSP